MSTASRLRFAIFSVAAVAAPIFAAGAQETQTVVVPLPPPNPPQVAGQPAGIGSGPPAIISPASPPAPASAPRTLTPSAKAAPSPQQHQQQHAAVRAVHHAAIARKPQTAKSGGRPPEDERGIRQAAAAELARRQVREDPIPAPGVLAPPDERRPHMASVMSPPEPPPIGMPGPPPWQGPYTVPYGYPWAGGPGGWR